MSAFDGSRISSAQREFRDFFARLLRLVGEFTALNPANIHNEDFGRLPADPFSIYTECIGRLTSGATLRIVSEKPAWPIIDTIPALTPVPLQIFTGIRVMSEVLRATRFTLRTVTSSTDCLMKVRPSPSLPLPPT